MAAAFKLGELYNAFSTKAPTGEDKNHILSEAAALVGRLQALTPAEFSAVYAEIVRIESDVSVVTRVRGFFTFVNSIWLLASIGIAVSIGPTIYHLLVPLREAIRRTARWLADNIIIPVARRLHGTVSLSSSSSSLFALN
jgi:hypothetical protein